MRLKTDLSKFYNSWYDPGAGLIKRTLWYFTNALFFLNPYFPFSSLKVILLRIFGANIGKGVVIKPRVNIKYPWKLTIGDFTWIGEQAWIDNLDKVQIGANCCLSQGAMLLCGSHDYGKISFDLITKPITLEDGAWIGAFAVVCPGVRCETHSVLAVSSVATKHLEAWSVYQGNPAVRKRPRMVNV